MSPNIILSRFPALPNTPKNEITNQTVIEIPVLILHLLSTKQDEHNSVFVTTLCKRTLIAGVVVYLSRLEKRNDMKKDKVPQKYSPKIELPYRLGLGGVAIGNEFEYVSDRQAHETLEGAWEAGVRLYDVAPWYGLGLAERRYGMFLHNQKREDFYICSKVGKLLTASKQSKAKEIFPYGISSSNPTFDYSAGAVRRSIEDSLQRMGLDSLDIVYVHDVAPDNIYLDGEWLKHFDIATKGAFPELTKMKKEGLIKGWGVGTNCPEPILKVMEVAEPDIILMASQYSLIDHANALKNIFPKVRKNNVSLVMGSNLNAGFLSGSPRYNYQKQMPAAYQKKRLDLLKVAKDHNVDLRTASLQFASFPDVAAAIIPGAKTKQQIREDVSSMRVIIPDEFWQDLKDKQLIEADAPVVAMHGDAG